MHLTSILSEKENNFLKDYFNSAFISVFENTVSAVVKLEISVKIVNI